MKARIISACVAAACAGALWAAPAGAAAQDYKPAQQENASKPDEPKISDAERKAGDKIDKAKGPEAKLQAAAEFVKKFPQSALRPRVAQAVAGEIAATQDNQLRASLAETYAAIFNAPGEAERLTPVLLDAYISGDRVDDAFTLAPQWLAKNPDDVYTLHRLTVLASNETIKNNNKYAAVGRQYGAKAIELVEADKMPAGGDAAKWPAFKTEALPALYRATGIIALKTDDRAGARRLLEKAVEHNTPDPGVYLVLSDLVYADYELTAKQHQIASAAEKGALLQKANAQLDQVIETFARAIAMSEGNAQYQPAAAQLRENLTTYYKYRHNGSTDGLQQLIDKYKKK